MLDTTAAAEAFSASSDLLASLEQHDQARREAAAERLQRSVPEFEGAAKETIAATQALVAGTRAQARELAPEEIEQRLATLQSMERTFAMLLDAKRDVHRRVLAFLSRRDRALLSRMRPLVARDEEASVQICEALRDARWAVMAVLADVSPPEKAVEVSSASDIRRALIGR